MRKRRERRDINVHILGVRVDVPAGFVIKSYFQVY